MLYNVRGILEMKAIPCVQLKSHSLMCALFYLGDHYRNYYHSLTLFSSFTSLFISETTSYVHWKELRY